MADAKLIILHFQSAHADCCLAETATFPISFVSIRVAELFLRNLFAKLVDTNVIFPTLVDRSDSLVDTFFCVNLFAKLVDTNVIFPTRTGQGVDQIWSFTTRTVPKTP